MWCFVGINSDYEYCDPLVIEEAQEEVLKPEPDFIPPTDSTLDVSQENCN